ncbi:low temperature requirement protein A [Asanoa sp. NPDC049573]|uniref:low temperature requirement protein A n=1 Tax=Asanoa sp. NPDC049573 TaxID=3155396 RepID=UPI003440F090
MVDERRRADGAGPFELFFDLVYVFAVIRITAYMAHEHTAIGVVRGLLTLALLWGTWSGYSWPGNPSRAGMVVAMVLMFPIALTIPEAWHDGPGGLDGPLVLVLAYLLVRWVHLGSHAVAGDAPQRRMRVTRLPMLAGAAPLISGALLGGGAQLVLFAVAVLVEWVGGDLAARRRGLHDAAQLAERHGLFVTLAIGESVVAIGIGAAGQPVSLSLLLAGVLGIATAICLWWLYFDVVSRAAERRLEEAHGRDRVALAVEAYTYGQFPIVAGILLAALGVGGVLGRAGESRPLGLFSALALFGGLALYLGGHLVFEHRVHGAHSVPRLLTAGALLVVVPAAAALPPLAGLAGLVVILTGLIVVETGQNAELRQRLRAGPS